MLIDCNRCEMRGIACSDCVVSALLGPPSDGADLDVAERQAIGVLADAGLISPLRLVETVDDVAGEPTQDESWRSAIG